MADDVNVVQWLGSAAPTVGQKVSAESIPVVLPYEQDFGVYPLQDNGLIGNVEGSVFVGLAGRTHAAMMVHSGDLVGSLVAEVSIDSAVWVQTMFHDPSLTGAGFASTMSGSFTAGMVRSIVIPGGYNFLRVRCSAYTSGSSMIVIGRTMGETQNPMWSGRANQNMPPQMLSVGGEAHGLNNMVPFRMFDVDAGAGGQWVQGVSLRKSASGGSVEAGTESDPIRVDPTGSTVQPVTLPMSDTANVTTVSSSTSGVTLLAANSGRKGATIYNNSSQFLFVKLGSGANASSSFTVRVASQASYEVPAQYRGIITGDWAGINGNAMVTELV